MRKWIRASILAGLTLAAAALPARAQTAKQFGIIAGVDFANFYGGNVGTLVNPGVPGTVTEGSLTGFLGGLYLAIPFGDGHYMLEPELLYEGKGAKYDISATLPTGTVTGDLTLDLEYISVPVLLRYNFDPAQGPYLLAGISANFNVTCKGSWGGGLTDVVSAAGEPTEPDCADLQTSTGGELKAQTTFGGVAGAGFRKDRFGLEARYDFDMGDAYQDVSGVKNEAWEILVRYMIK